MYADAISHLPDPDRQAEFYDGVAVKRGIAWVLDTIVVLVMTVPVALFFTLTIVGILFVPMLVFVIAFAYRWFTISGNSATWGMRLMSIEFRDAYGKRFDSSQALFHTVGYTISMAVFPLQLVSIGMMLLTQRGQGLTDHFMGTVALNRRV